MKKSPRPKRLKDSDSVKLTFTLTEGQRKRFQAKIAKLGINQSDLVRAFALAFTDRYTTGGSLGLAINVKTKKKETK